MAPMMMFVFSGTVSIELTSKPTFRFFRLAASDSLLLKNSGSPVAITLPTLPVPAGNLRGEQLFSRIPKLHFLARITAPEGGGIVHLLEGDFPILDEIERHGLRLEGLHYFARGQLDDGVNVLAAGGRFGNDLDEERPPERAGENASS